MTHKIIQSQRKIESFMWLEHKITAVELELSISEQLDKVWKGVSFTNKYSDNIMWCQVNNLPKTLAYVIFKIIFTVLLDRQ